MLSFDTSGDFKDNYKFLIGSILPRPIAFVSTLNADGSNNVAPFSFFTGVSAKPMIIAFCPLIRTSTGQKKDTVINIEREKEFIINFVSEEIMNQVNLASTELEYGKDEFEYANLTALDSDLVKAKRVKEAKIHFECILKDILSYGEDIGSGRIITGEVKKVHIDKSIYEQGRINTSAYSPVGRGAGLDWIKCDNRIELPRLMKAQIQK
jgi:flavin reductase (DIM6/NTAB) family NADH-FMN oxidoreductase RutF